MFDARVEAEKIQATFKPYYFIGMDGTQYALPNAQLLTGAQIARLMSGDESVIKELNDAAFEAIQAMAMGVGELLAEDWLKHGGAEEGNESGESQQTVNAGTPSSPTSPSVESTPTN